MYFSLLSVGIGCGAAHILLHKGDVVVLFQVSVFLQVGSVVLWHCPDQIFDKFVGNERVSEIEFGDIWLLKMLISLVLMCS